MEACRHSNLKCETCAIDGPFINNAFDELHKRLTLAEAVVEAARAWAIESREDLGHDKLNLTWLVQNLAEFDALQAKGGKE